MLYHKLLEQKKYLLTEIQNLKHRLASYPARELICAKNGKYVTYMHSLNGTYTYIPKKNSDFIKVLGVKKLFSASLEDLQKELQAVNAFLKCYKSDSPKVEQLISHPSGHIVHSKSEALIDQSLFIHKIPFVLVASNFLRCCTHYLLIYL